MTAANAQCVTDIVERYSRDLRGFLGTMIRSREDIEDLMQETFLRVATVRDPAEIRSPRSFLFSLAYHLVVDRARRRKSSALSQSVSIDGEDFAAAAPSVEDEIDSRRDLQLLSRAVMRLPVQTQQIFVLRKFCDWSYPDLARHFGLSEPAVRQHVSRALHECMDFVQRHNGTTGTSAASARAPAGSHASRRPR